VIAAYLGSREVGRTRVAEASATQGVAT
jgi:hypothetical protein